MDAKDKIDDHLGITSVAVFQKYVIVQLGILLNDAKTSEFLLKIYAQSLLSRGSFSSDRGPG